MPKKDRFATHSDAQDSSVHLKSILGVRPGIYLTTLYGLAIAIVLFFLLFYPGLHRRGLYFSISTLPEKTTVKVDGKFAGTTPCTIFVQNGKRRIEISKQFYEPVAFDKTISGRVFFTLFVPERAKEKRILAVSDINGLIKWSLEDFQKNPDIPQIISEAVWTPVNITNKSAMYEFLDKCLINITNESQLRELIRASSRISSNASFLTPISLIQFYLNIIHSKQKYDNFPAWLLLSLSRASAKKLVPTSWISQYLSAYREKISEYYQAGLPLSASAAGQGNTLFIQEVKFRGIPNGDLVLGKDENIDSFGKSIDLLLPHPIAVKAFYLGQTEVTNRQFQSFLDENPDWAPGNVSALVQKALTTDGYLADWSDGKIPAGRDDYPVTSVSFYAANAYCEWLTKKLQSTLPGYFARLPTEAEWEWAARGGLRGMPYPLGERPGSAVFFVKGITGPSRAGSSEPNGYGLRDMLGNVWEWCSDSFAPSAYLLSSFDAKANAALALSMAAGGNDKVVRGGSWNNQKELIKVFTRGSQPAEWCTPYLGFRVAISRQ